MRRKQNDDFKVWNFRRFLFGLSPDVPIVKVRVLTSDIVLLTLLSFIVLQILRIGSICCARLLFGVCYYVNARFTPRRMTNVFHYGEQNLSFMERLLLIFIYFNSKFKVTCKKRGLWIPVYQNSLRRKKV